MPATGVSGLDLNIRATATDLNWLTVGMVYYVFIFPAQIVVPIAVAYYMWKAPNVRNYYLPNRKRPFYCRTNSMSCPG